MRLRRLDLVRYGKFTEAAVDFGARDGRPDLHVVYGPNEAGKSTAFSAFLDLLFGIDETRKPGYGFLHKPQGMRIGAALEVGGGVREVVRLFRQPLLDARERPLPDALVADELGGLTRETYRTMFSLDDDTLEAGGRSIVASAGDLGQLLFSASAGLSGFSRDLAALRAEAEAFYKTGGKSQELGGLKKRLKELKLEKEGVDTLASAYGQLVTRRDKAAASYEAALRERGATKTALDATGRRLAALPLVAELLKARREAEGLSALPPVPPGWEEALPGLQAAEVELATRADAVGREIERLAEDLRAMPEDDGAADSAPALGLLATLRPRHVTAVDDLPDRRTRLLKETVEVDRLLRLLEGPAGTAPAGLLLPAKVVGRLRSLMEKRSGVEASLADAALEATAVERQVASILEDSPAAQAEPDAAAAARLGAAIAAAQRSDHLARIKLAERSLPGARALLDARLAALEPWTGDASELARTPAPDAAELSRLDRALADAGAAVVRHGAEFNRIRSEVLRGEAAVEAIRTIGGPPDDDIAASARRRREDDWKTHRAKMNDATAAAFEASMTTDDDVAASRLASFGDVVALREKRRTLHALRAEEQIAERALGEATGAHKDLDRRRRSLLSTTSPSLASMAPDRIAAWLSDRQRALDARSSLATFEGDLKAATDDLGTAELSLSSSLSALGVRHDAASGLPGLIEAAGTELGRLKNLAAAAAALSQSRSLLEVRQGRLGDATAAEASWTASWAAALDGTWLASSDPVPEVAVVREVLVLLADLGPAIERRDELADRIGKMEASNASFSAAVEKLAVEMGIADARRDPIETADLLAQRVERSKSALAARSGKAKDLADAETRRIETLEVAEAHRRRKGEMIEFFDVASLAEVAAAMGSSRRGEALRDRCGVLEASIVAELGANSIEEAIADLEAVDRATLEGTRNELGPRHEDQDQSVRDLYVVFRATADALDAVGGDDAPSRIEERRRTLMLEIEDKAMRFLALRAGILATEEALHLYREKHRSSMMDHAGRAFSMISEGAYTGLAAHAVKDGETLVGKMAGGGSKLSTDMSKGTRFQLYLALRVAGYHDFVRSRAAVPFVADDIMETFDDARAGQAFRLLARMAEAGQVIYLTHHRHLCEIAERACPGVTVHEIGGSNAMDRREESAGWTLAGRGGMT